MLFSLNTTIVDLSFKTPEHRLKPMLTEKPSTTSTAK
jgi:hypothetical protein